MHDHSALIWLVYVLGQLVHIFVRAAYAVQSKLNSVKSYRDYFYFKWPVIVSRFFIALAVFPLVWDNPKLFNIDGFILSAQSAAGIAAILGWFSDSLLDKILGLIPWFKQELPAE
jgi:hypothetical protein